MIFIPLVEEAEELAREFVNKEEKPAKYSEEKLFDAIADILIMAFFGIPLQIGLGFHLDPKCLFFLLYFFFQYDKTEI
jgi:hypothetical protein